MEQSIAVYIKRANNICDKLANQLLLAHGLSSTQFKFLKFLYMRDNFSVIQQDIERYFDMSNPTVTRVLQKLEQKGFIVRKKSQKDGRSKLIGLTEKSLQKEQELQTIGQQIDAVLREKLNLEQTEQLKNLLQIMLGDNHADS